MQHGFQITQNKRGRQVKIFPIYQKPVLHPIAYLLHPFPSLTKIG